MTLAVNLRKGLHYKRWEPISPLPITNAAGGALANIDKEMCYLNGSGAGYMCNVDDGGWAQLPTSAIGGTFTAGATANNHKYGPSGTATGGTTTTIITNLTILKNIAGSKIRITGGPNVGVDDLVIESNTIGANSVITVAAQSAAFSASTTYTLLTGRIWQAVPGTALGYFDLALGTWTTRSVTGLTFAGTSGNLCICDADRLPNVVNGTSSGSNTTTTLNDTTKSWTVNALANAFQVRIKSGTGAGQYRRIASNTATALTVTTAWTVTPDATSVYVVEGDDDSIYFIGAAAVTLFRYSISGNTWATVTPTVARAAAAGSGATGDIVYGITDSLWNSVSAPLNGRYIYSFRGASSAILDVYDIVANAWAAKTYVNQQELFSAGFNSTQYMGNIYLYQNASSSPIRILKFDVLGNILRAMPSITYPGTSTTDGNKLTVVEYKDGANVLPFLYLIRSGGTEMFRMMLF